MNDAFESVHNYSNPNTHITTPIKCLDDYVVLIYKRTHKGDPDDKGIFGINTCMKSVRNSKFDAVIGIGGKTGDEGIAYRINYVGLGATKPSINPEDKCSYVIFENFIRFDENGEKVEKVARKLYEYLYVNNVRVVKLDKDSEYWGEVKEILKLAENAPPSSGYENLGDQIKYVFDDHETYSRHGAICFEFVRKCLLNCEQLEMNRKNHEIRRPKNRHCV